ncbi:hypothetical protein N7537_008239 [Penicillium hordei]|uniref:Homeobox domain-containing protein n=1 Tax=Penicillium hordei TaxID=40994 RepID=A0AAD6E026_9EURO|nr:uncharacterized protein N7537_008239 [Penicillium hordei]KAJ5598155.1 hypothetical protein N7537_008239 [Penicillium hordei]
MDEHSSVDEFESGPLGHDPFPAGPEPISWGDVATSEQNALGSLVQYQPRLDSDLLAEEQLVSLSGETNILNLPHDAIGASTTLWPTKNTLPPKSGNRFNPSALKMLKRWFANHEDHPYPTSDDIQQLEAHTSLSQKQIQNWFSNMRRRSKVRRSLLFSSNPYRTSDPIPTQGSSVDIPPRPPTPTPFGNMNPLQRWESSPPEHEAAAASDISRAIAACSEESVAYSSQNSATFSGNASLDGSDGTSYSSIGSGSGSSAYSFGERTSLKSQDPLKDMLRRRRRRTGARRDEKFRVGLPQLSRPLKTFQCTFCTETFKTKFDWHRHEKSLHLSFEKWICSRDGSVVPDTNGGTLCTFCGEASPNEQHLRDHNAVECSERSVEERTFYRKDHLRQHLRLVHAVDYSEELMKTWNISKEDIKSRCGFCGISMTSWIYRANHLGQHFKAGKTMADWEGDWGFDDHVSEIVENAMPPYLIHLEQVSPLPFSAVQGPTETPTSSYELLKLELEYYMQHQFDSDGSLPSDPELQYEACSIIHAAEISSPVPAQAAPSWLRDVFMSSDEPTKRTCLRPVNLCKVRVSQLSINGKNNIFENCNLELELRNFIIMHQTLGLALSDSEIQEKACNVISHADARFLDGSKRFMDFMVRLIWGSVNWITFLLERAGQQATDGMDNANQNFIPTFPELDPGPVYLPSMGCSEGTETIGNPMYPASTLNGTRDTMGEILEFPTLPTDAFVGTAYGSGGTGTGFTSDLSLQVTSQTSLLGTADVASGFDVVPNPACKSGLARLLGNADSVYTTLNMQQRARTSSGRVHFHNGGNSYLALVKDLSSFAKRAMSIRNPDRHIPTDEEIKYQARWIWYEDDDPWNQTPADNEQWLREFKLNEGIPSVNEE